MTHLVRNLAFRFRTQTPQFPNVFCETVFWLGSETIKCCPSYCFTHCERGISAGISPPRNTHGSNSLFYANFLKIFSAITDDSLVIVPGGTFRNRIYTFFLLGTLYKEPRTRVSCKKGLILLFYCFL